MKKIITFMLLSCVWMSGCTTFDVVNDYDASYDYQAFQTYAWLPDIILVVGDGRVNERTLEMRIKSAVAEELGRKGLKRFDNGEEDFLVGFNAALNEPLYRDKLYEYRVKEFGRATIIYEERSAYTHPSYETGSLVIDVIIPESNEIVWRGSAQAKIQMDYVSIEAKKKRLKKAVHKILSDFPPNH